MRFIANDIENIAVCVIFVVAGWLRCKQFRSKMAMEDGARSSTRKRIFYVSFVIIFATGGARSLLLLVLKIEVLVLATGGAKSSTLRRTSMSRSSFPEKTQQPGKLIKKNTEKLLC